MGNFGVPLIPETNITDYETGYSQLYEMFFAEHSGCWLHYSQCKSQGMTFTTLLERPPNSGNRPKVFLGFLPPNEILRAFKTYCTESNFKQQPVVETFFAYVEKFLI